MKEDGSGGTGDAGCVWEGDLNINNDDDVAQASAFCEVTGNLTFAFSATDVVLPELRNVHGWVATFEDIPTGLRRLNLPALTHTQGIYIGHFTIFEALHLESLTTIDDGFLIAAGSKAVVTMPALRTIGTHLLSYGARSIDAGALESVGGVVELYGLSALNVPKLATIGEYLAVSRTSLTSLDLPSLVSIGELPGSPHTALDLDPYAELGICVEPHGNLQLGAIHAPRLAKLGLANDGAFNIGYNPLLPQCRIDALAQQLQQAGWTGNVLNADPSNCLVASGPCP